MRFPEALDALDARFEIQLELAELAKCRVVLAQLAEDCAEVEAGHQVARILRHRVGAARRILAPYGTGRRQRRGSAQQREQHPVA